MNKRPTAVTVIGWFWRVGGILGMAFALPLAHWGKDLYACSAKTSSALRLLTF
jgi:hypothetical protein